MKIAVIFPGIGYHCDKPLLYYAREVALELGYEKIIKLNYSYAGTDIRNNETKMKEAFDALFLQANEALSDVSFTDEDDVLFISKSVGTIIASAYAEKNNIKCRQILYTPLKYTYQFAHDDAIAFIGTSDAWSNVDEVVKMSNEQSVPIHVYEGLNHSLESENAVKNIATLKEVIELTKGFMV